MTPTVHLADDVERRAQEALRLNEPAVEIVHRILDLALPCGAPEPPSPPLVVEPLDLQIIERWNGMTPSEILAVLDDEEYMEKQERLLREFSAALHL